MAFKITSSCVNCLACISVCPTGATREARLHVVIQSKKCTECDDHHDDPQCATICPIEGAIVTAAGAPVNPPGSLTGIPPAVLARVREELGYDPLVGNG